MNEITLIAAVGVVGITAAGVLGLVEAERKAVPLPRPKPAFDAPVTLDVPPQSPMTVEEARLRRVEMQGDQFGAKIKGIDEKLQLLEKLINEDDGRANERKQPPER